MDKYLKISRWLKRRYTDKDGYVTWQVGHFMSLPAALDYAAWRKYSNQ